MRRRRYRKRCRRKRRGWDILPYIKNKVYFGGKLQREEVILSGLLAKVILLIDEVI